MTKMYSFERIEGWKPEPEHVYEGRYNVKYPNKETREAGIVGVMNLVDGKVDCDMTNEVHCDLQAFRNFLKPVGNGQQ